MLLWVWILSLYGFALACTGFETMPRLRANALSVQGLVGAGFLLFILLTSNPFTRIFLRPQTARI